MPELPDVESFKKYLDATSLHQKVKSAEVLNRKILENISVNKFREAVRGQEFKSSKRIGKNLFVELSGKGVLLIHFGMTGYLEYHKEEKSTEKEPRVIFHFDSDYELDFFCQRMLGKATIIESIEKYCEEHDIGPDILEIGEKDYLEAMMGKSTYVKSFLMDQKQGAGIGNIYSDEILFQSGIHPQAKLNAINEKDMKRIYKNIQMVMAKAIEANADVNKLPKSYLLPRREKKGKCPNCSGEIKTVKTGGRTAYFCPNCQTKK